MAAHRRALAAKLILTGTTLAVGAATLAMRAPAAPASAMATLQSAQTLPLGRRIIFDVARSDTTTRPSPSPAPFPASTRSPARSPADPRPQELQRVKRVLDIGPIRFGDYAWDSRGVPAGPLVITVDLAAQTLSVFRGGYEIGATAILYGTDDKPTPLGTFPILMKDAHHVSSLYGAPMPYTLRLTGDGVSVHGTEVARGYATHGCIGVPTAFAKRLFAEAKVGDRVIITRAKTLATGQALIG